jgi:hypothetical protein
MKNKFLFFFALIASSMFVFTACDEDIEIDSKPLVVNLPFIHAKNMQDAYVYGKGQDQLEADLPAIVAIAVDTVYGFEGGRGGKTGKDTIDVLKSEVLGGFPDLSEVGGYSIEFEKINTAGYKVKTSTNIVIAGAIANPGPTALEGNYKRIVAAGNGHVISLKKVFDGVYVIDNPGGAASVAPFPYLFYNYKNSTGGDSLSFPIQTNPCGGGLMLVGPAAAVSLTADEYLRTQQPTISATSPLTFKWKVFEFPSASPSAVQPNAALCQWGHTAVRTFEKQ